MGMTAGRGNDGAGDTDRLDENEERLLWLTTLGGFIGRGRARGVPGADGTGDPMEALGVSTAASCDR